jgi:predicted Rossmann-fold nucleotide-binding protein
VILNENGFYDALISHLHDTCEKGFMSPATNDIYYVTDSVDSALDYIEGYTTDVGRVFKF